MNSEELWETTLEPLQARPASRHAWKKPAQAERMFSVLMGEDVETPPGSLSRNHAAGSEETWTYRKNAAPDKIGRLR